MDIKDGDIKAADIGSNEVCSAEIAACAVNATDIAKSAVNSTDIEDDTVKYLDIASNTILSTDIAKNAVESAEIAKDAVNSTDIDTDAVKSEEILNETIDNEDLDDAAIPSVVLNKTGTVTGLTNTWSEDFNTTISTGRKMAFIFTYAANLANTTFGNSLLAKACVVDSSGNTYDAEPSPVRVADDTTLKFQRSVIFTNSSVKPGNYYVNVSVKTTKADGTYTNITDRVFTVIALPTA